MKFLVVFACALAAASAGHIVAPLVYGAQHLPVIGANGVPVDTAEVQHARAAHLAHKIEAHARNGDYAYAHGSPIVSSAYAHAAPIVASTYAHAAPVGYAHHGLVGHSGYAHHGLVAHAPAAYPTTHVLPANINGVPLETPEVVAAKSHHFAAHAEANARNAHSVHYIKRRGIYAAAPIHYAAQHLPIIGANGVPVDTAEVQHARAAHFAHKVEAHARNGDYAVAAYSPIVGHGYGHGYAHAAPVVATSYAHSYAHPHVYSAPWAHHY